jgi:Uma2 family endonuclease
MAELLLKMTVPESPDISHIITEDDTPVDNIFSDKQQRLLTESLESGWNPGRPFVAAANVGLFYDINEPPVVPDVMVSLDAAVPEDVWKKENRSYFLQEYGKPPEIAVEIVSNKKGGEAGDKFRKYARAGIRYYIIFDPLCQIQKDPLRIFELCGGQYIPKIDRHLPRAGLGITLWEGTFEKRRDCWLRWCDSKGNLIPTGRESTELERKLKEQEQKRAEQEQKRAEQEQKRAEQEQKRADAAEKRMLETARSMLRDGLPPETVMKYTGFSAGQIEALRDSEAF